MKPSHILGFGGAMRPRPTRFHRTDTGIEIGGAYTRPPPLPSNDAERIQQALLQAPPRAAVRAHPIAKLLRWLRGATGGQR
jgi:hypothetical protein